MGVGIAMALAGAFLTLAGMIKWIRILVTGPKEKKRMEERMREKY